MARYFCVDSLPLDCRSPCEDPALPRGWRDKRHQGLHRGKTSQRTDAEAFFKHPRRLVYASVGIVLCFQAAGILFLGFKYAEMEAEMARYGAVIRRLEQEVKLGRDGRYNARDSDNQDTSQVAGLTGEVDHHGNYVPDSHVREAIISEQRWSSRKLLRKRHRRNGGRCKCNSRINNLERTMDEALANFAATVRGGLGIHLTGRDVNNIIQGPGTFFRWEEPNRADSGGFRLLTNSMIKVLESGIYIVYSQIAVSGRRYTSGTSSFNPSCGYETVKIQGQRTTVILTSVLTQDSRGHHYTYSNATNLIYPLDTLSHMGVFHLSANDRLAVRTSEYTLSDRFMGDPRYSYFGVVKIS